MSDFVMPSLGADMEEGTIIQWLVKPGDTVHRGDIIVEVETEKADMEVEVFQDGVIEELVAEQGDTLPVGALLARLRPPGATAPAAREAIATGITATPSSPEPTATPGAGVETAAKPTSPPSRVTPTAQHLAQRVDIDPHTLAGTGVGGAVTRHDVELAVSLRQGPPARTEGGRLRASPYARRLARELGVELSGLAGSGPEGAIVARDIERHRGAAAATPAPGGGERTERGAARKASRQRVIAGLMERSNREIPHYYLGQTVDISRTLAWLQDANAKRSISERLLLPALFIRAIALAADDVPEINGHFEDGTFSPSRRVNVGVAVSLRDGGLIAPAIQEAESKSVEEVMADLRDLVQRARSGKLRAAEMTSATITVTNLGDQGVESVQAIIYPPQVAIVGFGRVTERPWAENGMLGTRQTVIATLAGDHRVSNGHRGGRFLAAIDRLLQEPDRL